MIYQQRLRREMQQEDEEAGDVVVGVGVESQIDETVHADAQAEWRPS